MSKTSPQVIKLSDVIRAFPNNRRNLNIDGFRNPNGVYMKLCNFLRHDPSYNGKGLKGGSNLEKVIWDEFANNPEKLAKEKRRILNSVPGISEGIIDYESELDPLKQNDHEQASHEPEYITAQDKLTLGNKSYQQHARKILEILVRQAHIKRSITTDELVAELAIESQTEQLQGSLNLIANALAELAQSNESLSEIPAITLLATTETSEDVTQAIYDFPHWKQVLEAFNLELTHIGNNLKPPPKYATGKGSKNGNKSGGEGEKHKALKEFIAENPQTLERTASFTKGQTEFPLLSGDSIDILFENDDHIIAIEIKPQDAPNHDIQRGLFQCVKYQKVLEITEQLKGSNKSISTLLVIGGQLPKELLPLKHTLGIEVIEQQQPDK